nr:uncharacterized protein CTRU02_06605 [Colletotrichum truncatum]KAF6792522.1 hypothetical protein CTRU02_06605 [Colletotrichum truncatum]
MERCACQKQADLGNIEKQRRQLRGKMGDDEWNTRLLRTFTQWTD